MTAIHHCPSGQACPEHGNPVQPQRNMFDTLTRIQARKLMDLIGNAIHVTHQVCGILQDAGTGPYLHRDVPWHNMMRDLCDLHSDLFAVLCPESPAAAR
jgi:hypothetical protein